MKIIIAGGRDFEDYNMLKKTCKNLFRNLKEIEIVSGKSKGADMLGEKYANEKKYKISHFPAEWNKYGRKAGVKRNYEMAQYADGLLAFWDGKSKGTANMIKLARKYNLCVKIKYY